MAGIISIRSINGCFIGHVMKGWIVSNAYTELKDRFDHLQKRTFQLFDAGRKREGQLETAVANAWKQFSDIAAMDNISGIKERAEAAQRFMAETLKKGTTDV